MLNWIRIMIERIRNRIERIRDRMGKISGTGSRSKDERVGIRIFLHTCQCLHGVSCPT